MSNLAVIVKNGAEGVPRDAPRAAELYTRAIQQGAHVKAMSNLSLLLLKGAEGVPRNVLRAAELSVRAIAQADWP